MDFRNVTRLFADPEWDGPIEIDSNYPAKTNKTDSRTFQMTQTLLRPRQMHQLHTQNRLLIRMDAR